MVSASKATKAFIQPSNGRWAEEELQRTNVANRSLWDDKAFDQHIVGTSELALKKKYFK